MSAKPTIAPITCKLDLITEANTGQAATAVRDAFKESLGMTDEDMASLVNTNGGAKAFGNLGQCKAVKINRAVGIVRVVAGLLSMASLTMLIANRGKSVFWGNTIWYLGLVGLALTAFQQRHTVSLLFKLGWHAFGTSTRATMVLTVLSAITSVLYMNFKNSSQRIVISLLVFMTGIHAANVYFTTTSVLNPDAMQAAAVASALDRVFTARRITKVRKYYTRTKKE